MACLFILVFFIVFQCLVFLFEYFLFQQQIARLVIIKPVSFLKNVLNVKGFELGKPSTFYFRIDKLFQTDKG